MHHLDKTLFEVSTLSEVESWFQYLTLKIWVISKLPNFVNSLWILTNQVSIETLKYYTHFLFYASHYSDATKSHGML